MPLRSPEVTVPWLVFPAVGQDKTPPLRVQAAHARRPCPLGPREIPPPAREKVSWGPTSPGDSACPAPTGPTAGRVGEGGSSRAWVAEAQGRGSEGHAVAGAGR